MEFVLPTSLSTAMRQNYDTWDSTVSLWQLCIRYCRLRPVLSLTLERVPGSVYFST